MNSNSTNNNRANKKLRSNSTPQKVCKKVQFNNSSNKTEYYYITLGELLAHYTNIHRHDNNSARSNEELHPNQIDSVKIILHKKVNDNSVISYDYEFLIENNEICIFSTTGNKDIDIDTKLGLVLNINKDNIKDSSNKLENAVKYYRYLMDIDQKIVYNELDVSTEQKENISKKINTYDNIISVSEENVEQQILAVMKKKDVSELVQVIASVSTIKNKTPKRMETNEGMNTRVVTTYNNIFTVINDSDVVSCSQDGGSDSKKLHKFNQLLRERKPLTKTFYDSLMRSRTIPKHILEKIKNYHRKFNK